MFRKLKHLIKLKIADTNSSEYYDSVYKKGSPDFKLFDEWGPEIYHKIIEYLIANKINSGKLVDLGCGSGLFLKMLRDREIKFSITAVDFSEEALQRTAEKGLKDITLLRCPLDNLKERFKSDTFDIATGLGTYEHVYNYLDSFRQIYAIVKPEGTFILALPYHTHPHNDWYNDGLQTYWRNSKEKWQVEVESCGFRFFSEDFAGGHWILIFKKA